LEFDGFEVRIVRQSPGVDGFSHEPVFAGEYGMFFPEMNEPGCKLHQLAICLFPVDPGKLVILAIGVVIALL